MPDFKHIRSTNDGSSGTNIPDYNFKVDFFGKGEKFQLKDY
jgi:hypothetical protein